MDEIKKTIGYKPELKYEDEYKSDIIFKKDDNQEQVEQDPYSPIDDLIGEIDQIQNMIDKLPDFLADIVKDPIDPIIDFVRDELEDKELERVPVLDEWRYPTNPPEPETIEEPLEDPEDENIDEEDFWDIDDPTPIIKNEHSKEEVVKKEYVKNLYDLMEAYFVNLHNIISNFWSTLLYSIMNKEVSEIETIMENILLSSSQIEFNKRHILDAIVKTEITRDMKLRYFSNNFNAECSMKYLKNFKAVHELRLRYAKIEKNSTPVTKADQMSNNILEAMSISYDNKYDKTYYNLHRYLTSSNMILDDALSTAAQSIRAKQTLIDTKGVKK